MPSAEILAVLADEVTEAGSAISVSLTRLVVATEAAAFSDAQTDYLEHVQRLAAVCDALSLEGLRGLCAFIESNTAALSVGELGPERQVLFDRWPQLVLGYLKAPRDGIYSRELVEWFVRTDWPQPLDGLAAKELEQSLLALNDSDESDATPARASFAHPEDVVLEIPPDVNPKLVDAFLTEGPQQTSEYSALIQRVIKGDGWIDELNECRRLVHGLKGAANTVGVRGVATLCHHVEDIFEYLVEAAVQPEGELGKLLIKVADTLEMMFESLLGASEAPADAQRVLQNVLDWVNRIDSGEYDPVAVRSGEATAASRRAVTGNAPGSRTASGVEKIEPKIRIPARLIDSMLRMSGELSISGGHVRERLQQTFKVLAELRERHATLWDRSNDMESFVTTQGIAAGRRHALTTSSAAASDGFDPLELDQYSELHTYVHGLAETVADLQILGARLVETLTIVDTSTNQQTLVSNELHELLMFSRMIPAGNLDSRLQRTARQAADQCGKQVAFSVEGAEVMLDDQMVNMLIDPLQHLIRNAVDHGIETPSARADSGKPETGTITMSFARDGNYVVITCRDDGAGLDLARIRAQAIKRNLISEDRELSEAETARLILRSGFSTAETVTEMSGRGVGMDVVHTNVVKLKGSVDIRSQAGEGATFLLRVPMSLGIVHCLLAVAGRQTFAIPSDNLERIVYGGSQHLQQVDDAWFFSDDETSWPVHFLADLVGVAANPGSSAEDNPRHVVLINDVSGKIAVVVDAVTGGQDLVIKNMGRYLNNIRGVIGASILGDGSVVPILELIDLLRGERDGLVSARPLAMPNDAPLLQSDILVVDDSLSVRTALTTLLEEQGFSVRTAKDGVEAIEAIGERMPAAVLADLEMPRMNGLELTSHIRTNAATRSLPVIMVTSRTAEKHRNLAKAAGVDDYVTKPYQENDLVLRVRFVVSKAA